MIQENLDQMNHLIGQGQIIEAVDRFFDDNILTQEVGSDPVEGKAGKREGLVGFVNSIAAVRGITVHNSAIVGDTTYSEYTFQFDMKDGGKIDWHEVISRKWAGDKVIEERYFQN